MMCKMFFKLELFSSDKFAAVVDRSVAQHRKRGEKTIADS